MTRQSITLTDNLRALLKAARRDHAHLTQAQAADKAGVSEVWWSQLETGLKETVSLDTFVSMALAVKIPPKALESLGASDVAQAVRQQLDWFGMEAFGD